MKKILLYFLFWPFFIYCAEGQVNNALSFDGTDDYVEGNSINTSLFSVTAWINSSDLEGNHSIISMRNDAGKTGFSLYTNGTMLEVRIYNSGTLEVPLKTQILKDNWFHVALTYDASGNLVLYLNGSVINNKSGVVYNAGSEPLSIGCSSGTVRSDFFNGMIDEVAFWDRKLTDDDIKSAMLYGVDDDTQTNLVAHYKFNQGAPDGNNAGESTLVDSSVNANNATLNNFALSGSTSNWVSTFGLLTFPSKVAVASDANVSVAGRIVLSDAGVVWNASSDQSWLTLSQTTGSGSAEINMTSGEENLTVSRKAVVTVSAAGYSSQTIEVTQATSLTPAVNCTAGRLNEIVSENDRSVITKLTLTGTIDARDFRTMRDSMPALTEVDLSAATIDAYSGDKGTRSEAMDYQANAIPQYAFVDYNTGTSKEITSFIFPLSVTSIDEGAFGNCTKLSGTLNLPSSVTKIGNYAFYLCSGLTGSLVIPASTTSIGDFAFSNCTGLTGTLEIPSNVVTIGEEAFSYCTGFLSLTIPSSVKSIGDYAFSDCTNISGTVSIPSSISQVTSGMLYDCSKITSIVIPSSVTSIGSDAFGGCSALETLTIPASVTQLGSYALSGCTSLKGIFNIPSSIKEIQQGVFASCQGLTEILIPQSVTTIADYAFADCSGLTTFHLPSSVTVIREGAFLQCTGLSSIYVNSSIPADLSQYTSVFQGVNTASCILYVPYGANIAYAGAKLWEDFVNIVSSGHGFSISSDVVSLNYLSGSSTGINVLADVAWTASSDQEWLSVSQSTTAATDGIITLSAGSENSWTPRTAYVTVSAEGQESQTITVTQNGNNYKGDISTLTLSPTMDENAPVADRNSLVINSVNGTYLYLRFKPEISGTYTFRTESKFCDSYGTLYDASGNFLEEDDDSYDFEGNGYNFIFSYDLVADQMYYLRIYSYTNGTNSVPLIITGGSLESFTWNNDDASGDWSVPSDWKWGGETSVMPSVWNNALINGQLNLDEDVTVNQMNVASASTVTIGTDRMLYLNDTINNNGNIINNGNLFTCKAVINNGTIQNNGNIYGPVFAPVRFETSGGSIIETKIIQWGSSIELPVPEKTGCIFAGWFSDQNKTTEFTETVMPLNGFTLYAKWNYLPSVTTLDVTNIGTTTATGNGNITDIGSPAPNQYGVVWSTVANPEVSLATKTEQGVTSVAGTFTSDITGLIPGSKYYIRAYVTNIVGTSYGEEKEFTASKEIPVITWENPSDIVYGTPLSAAQLNATANAAGTFTYTPVSGTILNAGAAQSLKVDFVPDDASRYEPASKTVTININKAVLIVTANNQTMVSGGSVPSLTYTFSGFVNGDDESDISVRPTTSTTATSSSAAGTYDITLAGGSDENYDFNYVKGTLTITPATGIDDATADGVTVYPNPFKDHVTITLPDGTGKYRLVSVGGNLIEQGVAEGQKADIYFTNLKPGAYLLLISTNNKSYSFTVVKR